ncbi:hypothetical protein AC062_1713 [Pasteurellaceae bacterium NI1060]|nr:hypothetical protein AC062_1713 [Pasteurellaceae bacterium NI1060]
MQIGADTKYSLYRLYIPNTGAPLVKIWQIDLLQKNTAENDRTFYVAVQT